MVLYIQCNWLSSSSLPENMSFWDPLKYTSLVIWVLMLITHWDRSTGLFKGYPSSSVQLLICVRLFVTSWTVVCQASLSITSIHNMLKLMSIKLVMPSSHLNLCRPLCLLPSFLPGSETYPKSWFFPSGGQSIGSSASATVLPMNIQDWFILGLTVSISLQFKGLSGVFSNTRVQFSSVQSLSHVWLFATPWIAARQASLSITNSWSSPKPRPIESVMPSSHLILCHPLLLLLPIPPSISLFQWVNSSDDIAKVLEFQL